MKRILLIFLPFFFSTGIFAQLQLNENYHFTNWDALNTELVANNFPTLNNNLLSLSFLYAKHDDEEAFGSRTGYTLNITASNDDHLDENSNEKNEVNLRSHMFLSGIEYHLVQKKKIIFGPSLDFLIAAQRLKFIKGLPGNSTFSNILAGDVHTEIYRNIRLMFEGRLNLVFNIEDKMKNAIYGIGFTGGYRLDPFKENWKYERSIDVIVPGTKQNGLFAGIMVTLTSARVKPPKPPKKKLKQS